jgi:hypothetical protein
MPDLSINRSASRRRPMSALVWSSRLRVCATARPRCVVRPRGFRPAGIMMCPSLIWRRPGRGATGRRPRSKAAPGPGIRRIRICGFTGRRRTPLYMSTVAISSMRSASTVAPASLASMPNLHDVRCNLDHGEDIGCVDAVQRCQLDGDLAYVGVVGHRLEEGPQSSIELFVVLRPPRIEILLHLGG